MLTYRALNQLGIVSPTLQISLTKEINIALDKLYAWQNQDGGWGWWSNQESNAYLTAYVVYGMIEARDSGFTVRADSLSRGEEYLKTQLKANARDLSRVTRPTRRRGIRSCWPKIIKRPRRRSIRCSMNAPS